jgi:hypothetical protein
MCHRCTVLGADFSIKSYQEWGKTRKKRIIYPTSELGRTMRREKYAAINSSIEFLDGESENINPSYK